MAEKYLAYPEYKGSGVERLGQIPIDWIICRLKNVLKIRNGRDYKEVEVESGGYPVYGSGGIFKRSSSYLYDGKSILFGRKGTIDKPLLVLGRFWTVDTMFYSEIYDNAIPEYIYYQSLSFPFNLLTTNTALPSMTQEDLLELYFALPTLSEQIQIIDFLDYETAQIDTLIEKQQTLIQLLKEKRQAVISHAVTKGLNPDAPMKDSGVEWLGEVPEHWVVKGIKRLSEIKRGASPRPIADPKYFDDEGEYAWTRIADVSRAGMYLDTTTQRLSDLGASLSVKLEAGELFLSIAGTVGKPCITISKACIHDGFVYFPTLKINNKFLFYIFEAGQAYLGLGKMGTQLNLNTETVGGIEIGLPPKEEIEAIIKYIEVEKIRFNNLINKAEQAIQLMQERRTALISAAVTGKIDVQGWRAAE